MHETCFLGRARRESQTIHLANSMAQGRCARRLEPRGYVISPIRFDHRTEDDRKKFIGLQRVKKAQKMAYKQCRKHIGHLQGETQTLLVDILEEYLR